MKKGINFLDYLDVDLALSILTRLDNPADVVRASVVSQSWHHFVVANRLFKQLCLRMFPHISDLRFIRPNNESLSVDVETSNPMEWKILERDHKAYASLIQAFTKSKDNPKDCIACVIGASSTDRDPEESVVHTLFPIDRYMWGGSYWSSKGQTNPDVPETLIYKLISDVCVVTEIDIRPFAVYWEPGSPVYSAKSVRFRMGHLKSPRKNGIDFWHLPLQQPAEDKFIWSYTSPEFPMTQENHLQQFKLPEPVLCIGGCLQIELLGRAQREEIDGLFYICVCYVRVLGRPLSPAFELQGLEKSGDLQLKYNPEAFHSVLKSFSHEEETDTAEPEEGARWEHVRQLENLLQIQSIPSHQFVWNDDED
ncbi:F-box protein At4g00755-like isoform X1 [Olea europaea var. sylvestris]|uniref:F-box protein At4g00755-like isoform X1 n=2 Tax=Olea europaea var. sylvestris TaxID=158386 RepID=UPI000C1D2234|nr:F-box protein At4g00755-like isoform X1 [Olea europaea var. sylvestris]